MRKNIRKSLIVSLFITYSIAIAGQPMVGVGGQAKTITDIKIGVNGTAREVVAAWIGVNGQARKIWPALPPITINQDVVLVEHRVSSGGFTTIASIPYPTDSSIAVASLFGYSIDGYALYNAGTYMIYPFFALTLNSTGEKHAFVFGRQNYIGTQSSGGATIYTFDFSIDTVVWNSSYQVNGTGPSANGLSYKVINPTGAVAGQNVFLQYGMYLAYGYTAAVSGTSFHLAASKGYLPGKFTP